MLGKEKIQLIILLGLLFATALPSVQSESVVVGPGLNLMIPDGEYDGTLDSMACVPLNFNGGGFVDDAELNIGIDHPFVGDVVIKIQSPSGTTLTAMNRPGTTSQTDGENVAPDLGNHGQLSHLYTIYFQDVNTIDPATMGETINPEQIVCKDDGRCRYFPNPGAADGGKFADWIGEDATGTWRLCVGDAHQGNNTLGTLDYATLRLDFDLAPVVDLEVSATVTPDHFPNISMDEPAPEQTYTVKVSNLAGDATNITCTFDRPPQFNVDNITHVGLGFTPGGGFQPGQMEAKCETTGTHYECTYSSAVSGRGDLFETTFLGTLNLNYDDSTDNVTGSGVELHYYATCSPVMMFDSNENNNEADTVVTIGMDDSSYDSGSSSSSSGPYESTSSSIPEYGSEDESPMIPVVPVKTSGKERDSEVLALGIGLAVVSILCCLVTCVAVVLALFMVLRHRQSVIVPVNDGL